jgi:HEAT repeat protein
MDFSLDFASLREEKNFKFLCGALGHESLDIAIGASLALGRLQDRRATPYLLDAFLTTHGKKAQAVSWALGEIGAQFVPKSAIVALGKIGSPDSLEILLSTLNDDDDATRALAVKSIGQLRLSGDQKRIAKALSALRLRLKIEQKRSVKLVLCIICNRLERELSKIEGAATYDL